VWSGGPSITVTLLLAEVSHVDLFVTGFNATEWLDSHTNGGGRIRGPVDYVTVLPKALVT